MILAVKDLNAPDHPAATVGLTTATVRTLQTRLDDPGSRAELVARRLGEAIRLGLVLDGERLPNEPQLAEQFRVSPVTLREALAILREQGLVATRRGRSGGSFVTAPADLREPLRQFSVQELRDLGDQRCAVSGAAAQLAAERALPDEIRRLREQVRRLQEARTPSECRRADTEFTIAVAAAAQSPRLTLQEARLLAEVGDLLALELETDDQDALVRNRQQLLDAITARMPDRARALAELHVSAQTERLARQRLRLHSSLPRARAIRPADEVVGGIVSELERVMAALGQLGAEFRALATAVTGQLRREHLEALRPTILKLLATHGQLVTGAGIITAPNLLADAPRWLEWWWTTSRGAPEALRVNLDPAAPDFYDYTTAEYFEAAQHSDLPWMAGPYVDYACTNQYAITLSSPVWSGGTMLGVAGADVLVANLERHALPALAALNRPVALTNGDGRVIASNSGGLLPGQRIEVPETSPPMSARSPLRSWLLVDVVGGLPAGRGRPR